MLSRRNTIYFLKHCITLGRQVPIYKGKFDLQKTVFLKVSILPLLCIKGVLYNDH